MLNMLQPHILVNSIGDYYDVPGLKKKKPMSIYAIFLRVLVNSIGDYYDVPGLKKKSQ